MQLNTDDGEQADGFEEKRTVIPDFVQPLLKAKTEVLRNEESPTAEESEESDSDEEIATPLAVKKEVLLSREDQIASSNQSVLSHGFNTSCVRYYTKSL